MHAFSRHVGDRIQVFRQKITSTQKFICLDSYTRTGSRQNHGWRQPQWDWSGGVIVVCGTGSGWACARTENDGTDWSRTCENRKMNQQHLLCYTLCDFSVFSPCIFFICKTLHKKSQVCDFLVIFLTLELWILLLIKRVIGVGGSPWDDDLMQVQDGRCRFDSFQACTITTYVQSLVSVRGYAHHENSKRQKIMPCAN